MTDETFDAIRKEMIGDVLLAMKSQGFSVSWAAAPMTAERQQR